MSKSKVASIRALQELKGIVQERMSSKFSPMLTKADNDRTKFRAAISDRIQKEIEEYAVEKYKQYGLVIVPICHRSNSYRDSDIVRPELRVKNISDEAEKAYESVNDQYKEAQHKIDDWYFQAVQAVAAQVDLPATPEF